MASFSSFGSNVFNQGTTSLPEPGRRLLNAISGKPSPQVPANVSLMVLQRYRFFVSQPIPKGISVNDWQLTAFGAVAAGNWPALGEPSDADAEAQGLVLIEAMKLYGDQIPNP